MVREVVVDVVNLVVFVEGDNVVVVTCRVVVRVDD